MNLGSQNAIQSDDEDDAAPPPVIKRQRNVREEYERDQPPSVDELGVPNCNVPLEPITSFNWRIFFSSINFLRILQKICKNKGHRNLLLVQYKSSQYLKKALKVPQTDLRLYTLKLFKNQVPYCGRKWRQSNMRVITAVYLHCRPELRDDWLAGSDVDAEVEEALPLEQALRALTHWHNLKRYADKIGADQGMLEKEQDFFVKELQKMEWEDEPMASKDGFEPGWDGPIQVNAW